MKVITISGFGGPEVFSEHDMPEPKAGRGEVIIDVKASSVNPIDIKIRSGMVPPATPPFPAILHSDVSGIVSEVGQGVSHLQIGDEVWGCAGGFNGLPSGALAERLLTDAQLITKKPKNLSFIEAAALPLVSLTAWFALADRARVQAGDNVLVHAGGGGVGHVGIQIARHLGANVQTTVSNAQKAQYALELGAAETILYRGLSVDDYVKKYTGGNGYDIVFDTVGGDNLDASFQAARYGGTIVNIAARSTHDLSPMHARGLTLHVVFLVGQVANPINRHSIKPRLEKLRELAEAGELRPLIDQQQFEIEDVADAHAYLESGKAIGKVILMR
ncbi:MAG: quinone oxidoreductase [Gammaproteobacteria bacterium]|nr:quinone oxidoreductase [Gammaproteobacteria bacterium]